MILLKNYYYGNFQQNDFCISAQYLWLVLLRNKNLIASFLPHCEQWRASMIDVQNMVALLQALISECDHHGPLPSKIIGGRIPNCILNTTLTKSDYRTVGWSPAFNKFSYLDTSFGARDKTVCCVVSREGYYATADSVSFLL